MGLSITSVPFTVSSYTRGIPVRDVLTAGMVPIRALIVEDDSATATTIAEVAQRVVPFHPTVRTCLSVADAVQILPSWQPDIILLDLSLPDGTGERVLSTVRGAYPETRVCVVSASGQEPEYRAQVISAGADDFIAKPFSAQELSARIGALLCRSRLRTGSTLAAAGIYVPERARVVYCSGRAVVLGPREHQLLVCLMQLPGEVLKRGALLDAIWGATACFPNVVDVTVERLRAKVDKPFGTRYLKTAYREGYYFDPLGGVSESDRAT